MPSPRKLAPLLPPPKRKNMTSTDLAVRKDTTPARDFRDQLQNMNGELATALPPHVPVERFMRVVLTAVNGNPELLDADRRSLFEASMKAAQDGLLPDGRDGAFVTFKTKVKKGGQDHWILKAQWLPMVGGILKKVRNSGELLTISAHVVYERDDFAYVLGDEERIEHSPCLEADRGKPRLVYAIAKTKDGGIYREVMTIAEVEKVRNVSRAKDNGPWRDWWDEMAKKTVIRRLAKRLPTSADLDDLIRRDDELYDFNGKRVDSEGQQARVFDVVKDPLSDHEPPAIPHDPDTGEITDSEPARTNSDAQPDNEIASQSAEGGEDDVAGQGDRPPQGSGVNRQADSASDEVGEVGSAEDEDEKDDPVKLAEEMIERLGLGQTEKAVVNSWENVFKPRVKALPNKDDRLDLRLIAEAFLHRSQKTVSPEQCEKEVEQRLKLVRGRVG
jgi:recombination protein RecT